MNHIVVHIFFQCSSSFPHCNWTARSHRITLVCQWVSKGLGLEMWMRLRCTVYHCLPLYPSEHSLRPCLIHKATWRYLLTTWVLMFWTFLTRVQTPEEFSALLRFHFSNLEPALIEPVLVLIFLFMFFSFYSKFVLWFSIRFTLVVPVLIYFFILTCFFQILSWDQASSQM